MLQLTDTLRGRFLCFDTDRYVGGSLLKLGEFMEGQAQLFDLLLKPSSVVVEVGANIGAHTAVLAKRASWVHAFEPQRRIYNVLCANMALNSLDNVDCYRAAGGEAHALAEIPAVDYDCPENNHGSFSIEQKGSMADRVEVLPITLGCDFMKIDVEGYEAKVLKGATPMLRAKHPVLYVENDRKEKSDELVTLIHELGYKAYWHITPMFRAGNFRGVESDPFGGIESLDMLCLPKGISFDRLPEVAVGGNHPAMGRQ